jgi:electron-transferring-flavoprotein dehydrogenase
MRLKGIHLAMKSGMLAAEAIVDALDAAGHERRQAARLPGTFRAQLGHATSSTGFATSGRASATGSVSGLVNTGFQMLTGGRGLFERRRLAPDYAHMHKLAALNGTPTPTRVQFDEKLTFKKLTDVYHSGTSHE